MALANVLHDECATEVLGVHPAPQPVDKATPPFWNRVSPLLLACLGSTVALAVTFTLLGIDRSVTGQPDLGWLRGVGVLLICSYHATLFTGLRDFADYRNRNVESRIQAYVQCETFRLERGQTLIREQVAYLRSEMAALLAPLPEGVVRYGDAREDEGESRAVRRLTAASGEDNVSTLPGVPHLRSVPHRN
jgi:hypothetical protein